MSLRQMIDIPPVWLLLFAVVAWWQRQLLPFGTGEHVLLQGIGKALVALGCAVIGLAAWEFRRHRTTIIPHLVPKALVDTGVFALSRNPIYLADAIILTGLCLRWGAYASLILVPVFVALIQARFIVAEEARLSGEFPDEYNAYARKVRRWI